MGLLFRRVAKRYRPKSFAIDVRPRTGSNMNPRVCVCYISALRRAFDGNISKLKIEFENGSVLANDSADSDMCQEGNLTIDGLLHWNDEG